VLPYGSKKPSLFPRKTVRMIAGPPVDLSAFAGQPINTKTLRAATDVVMADVTALLAGLRGETPPAVPYEPAASGKKSIARTDSGEAPASTDEATGGTGEATASTDEATGGPAAEARPT
jgi:hypothetical protein